MIVERIDRLPLFYNVRIVVDILSTSVNYFVCLIVKVGIYIKRMAICLLPEITIIAEFKTMSLYASYVTWNASNLAIA